MSNKNKSPAYRAGSRWVGGTRNLDGIVTRTVGVTASSPQDAKAKIAARLHVPVSEVGLVSRRDFMGDRTA